MQNRLLMLSIALGLCSAVTGKAIAATYYINPSYTGTYLGTRSNPYNSWTQVTLAAGNTYVQLAGTSTTDVIIDNVSATSSQKIFFGVYGSGAAPVIGAIDFENASWAQISGFTITGTAASVPVEIEDSSEHITVTENTINAPAAGGILVANGSGAANIISYNSVTSAGNVGISIFPTSATASSRTQVSNNVVSLSGCDGILIASNYTSVTSNLVSENGQKTSGCSGIHVYNEPGYSQGEYNIISGNVAIGNLDPGTNSATDGQDGSGIELDQLTSNNKVLQNLVIQNDGGGIVIYDSASNAVTYNVAFSNSENRSGAHTILAEFVLNASENLTNRNTIEYNNIVGYFSSVEAIYVSSESQSGHNVFGYNTLAVAGTTWPVFQVGSETGSTDAVWITLVNSTSDAFTAPPLLAPSGPYTYTFPAGTTATVDGETITLDGWDPATGLYGTN